MRRKQRDATTAIGYLRCSTDRQEQGPKAQRDAIERYCRAHGLRLVGVHEDLGVSGAAPLDARPGLLAALDALRDGAGVLVVAKRDRVARDVVLAAMVERLVAREGARLDAADGTGNGDGPEHEMMRSMVAVFAQYERALIRARTRSALAAKKARGERVGSVPLGSRLAGDGVTLTRDDRERAAMALALDLRSRGLSFASIGVALSAHGHTPRGKRWHPQSVARLLANAETMYSRS